MTISTATLALATAATGLPEEPTSRIETLGPFALGPADGRALRVIATYREYEGAAPDAFARTLESWRIEDLPGGTTLEESYPLEVRPGQREFWIERGLWAGRITGGPSPFLLIEIGELPSAPGTGVTWRVFDLPPTGAPREVARFEQQGAGLLNERDARGDVPLAEGRFLDFDMHLGHFSLVLRYEFEVRERRFTAQTRCARPLDFRRDPDLGIGEVLLRARPAMGAAARVVTIVAARAVDLLEACLDHAPAPDESLDAGNSELSIRVKIDGLEG